ncbi:hypothetical protein B0H13DRAFT_2056032 [Mycena leptocephala]|nr:hypothetical protein B0H13DRAFT_2056032 [Mycena leptocephala]
MLMHTRRVLAASATASTAFIACMGDSDSRVKNVIAAHSSYARPFALLTIRFDVPSSSTSRSEQESAPGPIAHWASGDEDLVYGGQDRRLLKHVLLSIIPCSSSARHASSTVLREHGCVIDALRLALYGRRKLRDQRWREPPALQELSGWERFGLEFG